MIIDQPFQTNYCKPQQIQKKADNITGPFELQVEISIQARSDKWLKVIFFYCALQTQLLQLYIVVMLFIWQLYYNILPATVSSSRRMHHTQVNEIQNADLATYKLTGHAASNAEPHSAKQQLKEEVNFNLQRSKVAKFVNIHQDLPEVITLAYFQNNEQVHIDQETLYLLQKYSINQTCYLGFMGTQDSCRSFVLDTIINLSSFQGNHFTRVYDQNDSPGIFIWPLPYSYNAKLKTFIIQCRGVQFQDEQLSRKDQILIDLMVVLCSSIVLVGTAFQHVNKKIPIFRSQNQRKSGKSGNFLSKIALQFLQSKERIHYLGQASDFKNLFWPRSFYYIYGQKNAPLKIPNIEQLFHHSHQFYLQDPFLHQKQSKQQLLLTLNDSLKAVNPSFVKKVSRFFIDQILSAYCKQNEGLKWNGNVVCKLLINTVKYMNKKNKIKLDKILTSIAKELYQASFMYHCEIYDKQLKESLVQEQPFSFDSLLNILRLAESHTLISFNEVVISEQMHNSYEQKLMAFIDEKEKMLIEINIKKTRSKVKEKIKELNFTGNSQIESIKKYISALSDVGASYDHQISGLFSASLLKYTSNLQKRIIDQKLTIQGQRIAKLKADYRQAYDFIQKEKQRKEEIRKLNKENEKNYKKMQIQLGQLQVRFRTTRKEIDNEKKYQKQYIITKQAKKNEAEKLLELIREQQQKNRDNLRIIEEINKYYDYHPDILSLSKQIEEKERKIKKFERIQPQMEIQSRLSPIPSQTQIQKPTTVKKIKKGTVKR